MTAEVYFHQRRVDIKTEKKQKNLVANKQSYEAKFKKGKEAADGNTRARPIKHRKSR